MPCHISLTQSPVTLGDCPEYTPRPASHTLHSRSFHREGATPTWTRPCLGRTLRAPDSPSRRRPLPPADTPPSRGRATGILTLFLIVRTPGLCIFPDARQSASARGSGCPRAHLPTVRGAWRSCEPAAGGRHFPLTRDAAGEAGRVYKDEGSRRESVTEVTENAPPSPMPNYVDTNGLRETDPQRSPAKQTLLVCSPSLPRPGSLLTAISNRG